MTVNDTSKDRPDPVGEPALVSQVLRLFREKLPDVSFPDVNTQILEQKAAQLGEQRAAVAAARAHLRETESELDSTKQALLALAERALAYARVFATGDAELETALATLDVVKPPRIKAKPKAKARKGPGPRDGTPEEGDPQVVLPSGAERPDSETQSSDSSSASRTL